MSKPRKNHNACMFCLKSKIKNPEMSLHRFPKEEKRRSLWLEACGFSEEDYKPSRYLCSFHFEDTCYKVGVLNTSLRTLNRDAVPTIFSQEDKAFFKSKPTHMFAQLNDKVASIRCQQTNYEIKYNHKQYKKHEGLQDKDAHTHEEINSFQKRSNGLEDNPYLSHHELIEIIDVQKQKSRSSFGDYMTTLNLSASHRIKYNFINPKLQIIKNQKKIKILNLKVQRLKKELSDTVELFKTLKRCTR